MLILTHLLAFLAGALAILILARHVAARELALERQRPRPLSPRRLAIRRANADALPRHTDSDLSDRLVAELNAILDQE